MKMIENAFKSHASDQLNMVFEVQQSIFQMQNIGLSLLLGASTSSNFIDDHESVLKNCQSRVVQRNRRSYDQLDFFNDIFNL
jgi:hypothetical protein